MLLVELATSLTKRIVTPIICALVVVTLPLPWNGYMAEDHEAPEAGQCSRAWTRGQKERVAKE